MTGRPRALTDQTSDQLRCPVCGAPWSPREAARYAATQTTPPVGVASSGPPAVDPTVPEEPAGGVPIDANREVWFP